MTDNALASQAESFATEWMEGRRFWLRESSDDELVPELSAMLGIAFTLTSVTYEMDPNETAFLLCCMARKGDRAAFDLCQRIVKWGLWWGTFLPADLRFFSVDLMSGTVKRPRGAGRKQDAHVHRDRVILELLCAIRNNFPVLPSSKNPEPSPHRLKNMPNEGEPTTLYEVVAKVLRPECELSSEAVRNVDRDWKFRNRLARRQLIQAGPISVADRKKIFETLRQRFGCEQEVKPSAKGRSR